MQLFSVETTIFFKIRLLRKTQIHFFFLTAWAAQMAKKEEFMFQNLAYRPTVYRTGVFRNNLISEFVARKLSIGICKIILEF